MPEENTLNNITNKLILKYDDKFNKLYNKILQINSSIMNKEELIVKEDVDIVKKTQTILKLQIAILFILGFSVLVFFYAHKKISLRDLILYSILIYIAYYAVIQLVIYSAAQKLRSVSVAMKNYVADQFEEGDYGLQCPTSCPAVSTNPPAVGTITGYNTPTLRTDSQLNVWEHGDIPTDLYTSKKNPGNKFFRTPKNIQNYRDRIDEEILNRPKPFFGTTFPSSTYYECKWLGGDKLGELPVKEFKKYSSIPCDYRPNFEQKGKYLCLKNPNLLNKEEFSKYCDDVSN